MMAKNQHKYTPEQIEFLKEYIPGHSHKEILAAFQERFQIDYNNNQLKGFMARHRIKNGFTGHFYSIGGAKAYDKWEKGKCSEGAKKTWFKAGHKPHNTKPVGTICKSEQYLKIKIAEPNKWQLYHRYVWEQANGPIPKNYIVTFKDGNTENCELNNLRMVRKDDFAMVRRFSDTRGEARDVAITYSVLRGEIRRKRKNEKHNG